MICSASGMLMCIATCRTDSPAELELVRTKALAAGADAAVVSNHWAKGGEGAVDLAKAIIDVTSSGSSEFKFLYDLEKSIPEKIETICKEIYRGDGIELSELAAKQIETYTRQGYGNLPSTCCQVTGVVLVLMHRASLHGQNAVLILARRLAQGRPDGVHRAYSRCQAHGRCGLLVPHSRRHADHARSGNSPRYDIPVFLHSS